MESDSRPAKPATTRQHRPGEGNPLPGRVQTTRRQASPRALRITALGYVYLLALHCRECRDCNAYPYQCGEGWKLGRSRALAQRHENGWGDEWKRRPDLDRRIRRGDDFAGDAWKRGDEIVYCAPGHEPA